MYASGSFHRSDFHLLCAGPEGPLGMGADFKTKTRELRSGCYYVLPIPTHRVNTGIIIHSFIHSLIPPICVRHLLGSHV